MPHVVLLHEEQIHRRIWVYQCGGGAACSRARVAVGVLRDVTRFLKSDWFALYAAKVAAVPGFSSREQ